MRNEVEWRKWGLWKRRFMSLWDMERLFCEKPHKNDFEKTAHEYKTSPAEKSMEKTSKKNYTYIVECSDGTYYTGWTNDIDKRIKAHNEGIGAKYTRYRRPVKLVYLEESDTKQLAMKREAQIKRLTRQQKEQLIKSRKDIYGNN